MKLFLLPLFFVFLGCSPSQDGYKQDYKLIEKNIDGENRTTVIENLDQTIKVVIEAKGPFITVTRFIKAPAVPVDPSPYSAYDIAHMDAIEPGWKITEVK
jgi:hypothetical protein